MVNLVLASLIPVSFIAPAYTHAVFPRPRVFRFEPNLTQVSAASTTRSSLAAPHLMQALRIVQFFAVGAFNFTSGAFSTNSQRFTKHALDVDLDGRHYVITGANSGIGAAAARALAQLGATVHMVCRSRTRGQEARRQIAQEVGVGGDERVRLHICDLTEIDKVVEWAQGFLASGCRIDGLVNNAGLMVGKKEKVGKAKLERGFATNVLGGFVLTELLRPALAQTKGTVVMVSSGGMLTSDLLADELEGEDVRDNDYFGLVTYPRQKRQQVALIEYWARKYRDDGVFWASMHPGWTTTPGLQRGMPRFHSLVGGNLRSPEQGADTIVWLMASKEARKYPQGSFFFDRMVAPKHLWLAGTRYDDKVVDRLVDNIQTLLKERCSLTID